MQTVHDCKSHGYRHAYTVCPVCQHQYCSETWQECPSEPYHKYHKMPVFDDYGYPLNKAAWDIYPDIKQDA
jgi:hypothetical protein